MIDELQRLGEAIRDVLGVEWSSASFTGGDDDGPIVLHPRAACQVHGLRSALEPLGAAVSCEPDPLGVFRGFAIVRIPLNAAAAAADRLQLRKVDARL